MKKSIAILMVMALVAVAASAQVTVGGWGRGLFVPVMNSGADGVDSASTNTCSWGGSWGGAPRIGITVAGNSDNVGFQIDMNGDGNTINTGDQQKIWIKPVPMVTVQMGRVYDDTLRGNGTFGVFNWLRGYGTGTGEDLTFSRLGIARGNGQAFEVSVAPMANLFAAVYINEVGVGGPGAAGNGLTENLAKNAQIAAGYTIDGVGQIRAQLIQLYVAALEETAQTFEVAFKVTAIENLYADVGFAMNLNDKVDAEKSKNIAAYANYKVSGATVHALANVGMYEEADMTMEFGVGADYGLAGGLGLSADVRYFNDAANDGIDAKTTMFAGLTKGFSNGVIGAGVEIMSAADMGYAIPVRMEYWF